MIGPRRSDPAGALSFEAAAKARSLPESLVDGFGEERIRHPSPIVAI